MVAHRGYSGRYPENTLLSYRAAYRCGARYMELDLQLSRDCVPILHHDTSLLRMSGEDRDIRETKAKKIKKMPASYAEKFGSEFKSNTFTTFIKFCKWLKRHPEVTVFVEIKQESIDSFGISLFMDEVLRRILRTDVESQCVIISFNHEVINYSRRISPMPCGWVLPAWNDENKKLLEEVRPEYLFCDKHRLPRDDSKIWNGGWQWAIYNLDDVDSAIAMANRGMPFLETNQIETLMASRELSNPGSD